MLKLKRIQNISINLLLFYNVLLFISFMIWVVNSQYDLIITKTNVLLMIPSVLLTTVYLSLACVKFLIKKRHGQDLINLATLIIGILTIAGIVLVIALYAINYKMDIKHILIITCVLSLITALFCLRVSTQALLKNTN